MIYDQFKKIIETIEAIRNRSSSLYELNVDLTNFEDDYFKVIHILMQNCFDEDGHGWIDWYLYERVILKDKVNLANDENGKEICYDIPSLWDVVKNHLK